MLKPCGRSVHAYSTCVTDQHNTAGEYCCKSKLFNMVVMTQLVFTGGGIVFFVSKQGSVSKTLCCKSNQCSLRQKKLHRLYLHTTWSIVSLQWTKHMAYEDIALQLNLHAQQVTQMMYISFNTLSIQDYRMLQHQ